MSVPEVGTAGKVAEPTATDSSTVGNASSTTNGASTEPVQSTATDAVPPESLPEGASTGETAPKASNVADTPLINDGTLNYKGPGLVKSLIFSKKYFWFSDEPLEQKHLSGYLSSEKADIAHRNAAHATQTGKGLLYYTKRAEDKGHPAGILNLGEMTDLVKEGLDVFTFKINGHKHTFQAPSKSERDDWFAAVENKSEDAKAAHEGLVGSEGYKSQFEKFAKPVGPTGATTTKSRSRSRPNKLADAKAKESTGTAAAVAKDGSSSDEAKSKSKNRSQSGKRTSIFETLRGKKEEHDEKKEIKKEEKAEEKAVKEDIKKEEKVENQTVKDDVKEGTATTEPLDAAAIAARVVGAPVVPVTGTEPNATSSPATTNGDITSTGPTGPTVPTDATASTDPTASTGATAPADQAAGTTTRETAPKTTKRNSIFSNFFNKRDNTGPTSPSTEAAPTVPAKDTEKSVTSSAAPQIEDPVNPSGPETAAKPAAAATEPLTAANDSNTASATPDGSKPARRTSFFNTLGTKKEKKADATSDGEGLDGEGKKSSKLGSLFRKPSRAVPNSKSTTTETSAPTTETAETSAEPSGTTGSEAPTTSNDTAATSTVGNSQTPIQASA